MLHLWCLIIAACSVFLHEAQPSVLPGPSGVMLRKLLHNNDLSCIKQNAAFRLKFIVNGTTVWYKYNMECVAGGIRVSNKPRDTNLLKDDNFVRENSFTDNNDFCCPSGH